MITTSPLTNLATELSTKLQGGGAARQTFTGSNAVAFGWSEGLPLTVARLVESTQISGLSFDAVRVLASATPAKVVAERATKPTATQLQSFTVQLKKYAGLATFSLEAALSITALVPALSATIVNQCLVAFDTDAVAALDTDHGSTATGATWTEAILNGIAQVASAGQNPSVLVIAPADYAAAVQDPGAAFSSDPSNGLTTLFGLSIGVVVGATAGEAYVIDPRAAVAVENESSPMVLVDPYSLADTNQARLVVDLAAAFVVTQPAGVCQITVTDPAVQATQEDFQLGA